MIKHNLIAFTVQPIPMLGKVDLAAVFLNRKKLHDTNLFFGIYIKKNIYTIYLYVFILFNYAN